MAWIFFRELVGSASLSALGSEPSPIVKVSDSPRVSYCRRCDEVTLTKHQYGTMCELSSERCYRKSTSSAAAFHAKTSALRDVAKAWRASEAAFSLRSSGSQKKSSRHSSFLKTSLRSAQEDLVESCASYPSSGMIAGGRLYQPPNLVPRTLDGGGSCLVPTPLGSDSGTNVGGGAGRTGRVRPSLSTMARKNLWPTPRANDAEKRGDFDLHNQRNGLPAAAKMWPTPMASEGSKGGPGRKFGDGTLSLSAQAHALTPGGGQLNPTWVEWLMGYPLGWTVCEGSEIQWCRPKREKLSKGSRG